jgi:hypothetical protein
VVMPRIKDRKTLAAAGAEIEEGRRPTIVSAPAAASPVGRDNNPLPDAPNSPCSDAPKMTLKPAPGFCTGLRRIFYRILMRLDDGFYTQFVRGNADVFIYENVIRGICGLCLTQNVEAGDHGSSIYQWWIIDRPPYWYTPKTRGVVGTTKRRQAVIDPRPTSKAEGIFR